MRALHRLPVLLAVLALASPAAAHLALRFPPSRYGDFVLKVGPCGVNGGTRSDNVMEFEPGASIDVVWDEYVDHPGHFRIAFDDDGDDDFVDPACLSGCDTRSPEIELYSNDTVLLDGIGDTAGGESGVTILLPDIECENCTLQVIQVMYDKPPYVTPGNDVYYQCADLILRRADPIDCPGDCDDDGRVSVDELIAGVGILLGGVPMNECDAVDSDGDLRVGVDEMVGAVASALGECAN